MLFSNEFEFGPVLTTAGLAVLVFLIIRELMEKHFCIKMPLVVTIIGAVISATISLIFS